MNTEPFDKIDLLSAIIESSDDGILSEDLEGIISSWNHGMTELFDYSEAEMLGQPIYRLIPPERQDEEHLLLARIARGERIEHFETVRVRKDGRPIDVSVTLSPVHDERGHVVGASTIVRDVSGRRAGDDARRRLAAIVDSTEDGIVSRTLDGLVTSWNAGAEQLFGYTEEEMMGSRISRLYPPERKHEEQLILDRVAAGERVSHFETVRVRKGGERVDVSMSVGPVLDASGKVVGVSKIVRDITKQKAIEAALWRAKDECETANEDLEAFGYSVAHDLRAPLRSLEGFSRALLEDESERLSDAGKLHLRYIHESAEKMDHLIEDLLTLTKSIRVEMSRTRVDLAALAHDTLARLSAEAPGRVVDVEVAPDLLADADQGLMNIVMDNLLANAWKFTGKAPRARIEVGREQRPGETVFFVRDNGVGFDPKFQHKLFGVFQRLHSAEEFEGSGIGLALVKRIIRRHGGRVWAESSPGRGATFFFTTARAHR